MITRQYVCVWCVPYHDGVVRHGQDNRVERETHSQLTPNSMSITLDKRFQFREPVRPPDCSVCPMHGRMKAKRSIQIVLFILWSLRLLFVGISTKVMISVRLGNVNYMHLAVIIVHIVEFSAKRILFFGVKVKEMDKWSGICEWCVTMPPHVAACFGFGEMSMLNHVECVNEVQLRRPNPKRMQFICFSREF